MLGYVGGKVPYAVIAHEGTLRVFKSVVSGLAVFAYSLVPRYLLCNCTFWVTKNKKPLCGVSAASEHRLPSPLCPLPSIPNLLISFDKAASPVCCRQVA